MKIIFLSSGKKYLGFLFGADIMDYKKKSYCDKKKDLNAKPGETAHKCAGCWCGTWLGNKYFCMMPFCINKLKVGR
jgi:hypothetical protein